MTQTAWTELLLFLGLFIAIAFPTGKLLARLLPMKLEGNSSWETRISQVGGISFSRDMTWQQYVGHLLMFNLMGFITLMGLQLTQHLLPLNPLGHPPPSLDLAFNTAISFVSNTNWQSYSGEVTYGYLVQMLGLGVQNFVSAGTGIAVLMAVARGLRNTTTGNGIGNFYNDLTRAVLLVLIPLSIIVTLALVSQGVVQSFADPVQVQTVEGAKHTLPLGPAASQIAIKQLGTNGGGFFGSNSTHPFENPTPLSNFIQLMSMLWLPGGLVLAFGHWIGSARQGKAIFLSMLILFLGGLALSLTSEFLFHSPHSVAGSLEGKEVRNTLSSGVLWSAITTATSNGSVIVMHDSLSPLSGFVALFNMHLGEVVFGGVGSGLYGMIAFIILTVFIAGLMVGRTPEFLGKKIEAPEIRMAVLAILLPSALCLFFTAIAVLIPEGLKGRTNMGPHGFSEILYAYSSAAGNNGSAFGGLSVNTPFYNLTLGFTMMFARFVPIVAMLAMAGGLAPKKINAPSPGTMPTDGLLFVFLLIGIVIIVGALTFLPALFLGPLAEHFLMLQGRTF